MADTLYQRVSSELLPHVRQPAQYIGGELNQLVRPGDWERAEIRVALGFPDTYAIGMSHLGCQILYWLCNHTEGVCAERIFAPWTDAERIMRDRKIPLFTWDTRQDAGTADIFALSLQYELCFTTVLNMLDLAGIPLRAADRTDAHPLVLVGGPQADNPEPMADFVDLVVMGDGEHAMEGILSAYREYRQAGIGRRAMIARLARRFPWLYAPNLYDVSYHADGTIAGMIPKLDGLPERIERCKTPDFDAVPFPTRPLVPWVEVVHDRIGIEIMRGCPQVCRFCHAGYTKRPLNLRTVDRIVEIAEEAYWATGHREIGLLSLSTADYPHLFDLSKELNERFSRRMVNLSFPSLRVDKMLQNIPWMANQVRKGSITMAVEAAQDDMRRAIRKKVTDGNLLDGVREVYKAGWQKIKLYFMCGFPGERDEDIEGIWEICKAVSNERKKLGKGPGKVIASVGWLVPKPFTPFQWMAQPRVDYFHHARRVLGRLSRESSGKRRGKGPAKGPITLRTHRPDRSILEGVFSRGDRRLGPVIQRAWQFGARFDGWDECYNDEVWQRAYAETGVDPAWYAHRERSFGERLPWDHIGLHMRRGYLEESYDDVYEQIGVRKPQPALQHRLQPIPADSPDRVRDRTTLPVIAD